MILFTFCWLIWKERNKRIFDNLGMSVVRLAQFLKEEVKMHASVFRHHGQLEAEM
jgi:hypothetical protein